MCSSDGNRFLDVRHLKLVLFERIGVDDRHVDAPQKKQVVHVFHGTAGHDGQHVQVRPIIGDAGDLGGKADRRALELTGSEANRPRVHLLFLRFVG
jgi:hypothetical protein